MSKTVTGYVLIEGVSYDTIIRNPFPCVEAFILAQEAGILPQDLHVYVGSTRMYDGTRVEGVVIKGKRTTQQMVITQTGVVYDNALEPTLKKKLFEVLQVYVPANYKLEEMKKKVKGNIKGEKKKISGTKLLMEVELI